MVKLMHKKQIALLVVGGIVSNASYSAEIDWSGFMSVVGGKTLDTGTTYDVGYAGLKDAVYDDSFSFAPDSILGLQGQILISDKLRATLQFAARGGDELEVDAEWAYLTYSVTDEFSVNAGKFRLPLYYFSDYLDVGYSYYWMRPPAEVYAGPSSIIGVSTYYSTFIDDLEFSSQTWYGSGAFTPDGAGVDIELDNNWGINFIIGYDWIKLRGVYHGTDIVVVDTPISYPLIQKGLALIIDYDNVKFRSEISVIEDDSKPIDHMNTWYVSAGYSFGDITPHITYTSVPSDGVSVVKADVMTYGVAYNFDSNAIFKIEYQGKNPESGEDVNLITAGVDLIF
jgi:hypothetical protein